MSSTSILPRPLTSLITDFFWRRWSPSVLVMSSYGRLKHTFLDGSWEHTSVENTRGSQWCPTGLRDRPTPVSHFHERPPRCPWSTDAALCGWCQNGDSADPEHEPSQFSFCRMFAKPRCSHQQSRANSKISYNVGNWHSSSPLRRETAATGPSFLAALTTSGWLDYRLQDIHGPFGYWSEFVIPHSRSMRPKRAPLQGTPPPKERVGIFGEGCEILE